MQADLEISGATVVLLGQFNPAIFHPSWFVGHGIITEKQAEESQVNLVHPDVAQMTIGAIDITVEQERFVIGSASAPLIKTADWAAHIFGKLLTHTPISQAGINTQRHYRLPSSEDRHQFGRRLAPIDGWGEWGKRLDAPIKGSRNGVQIIAMREYWEEGNWRGWRQTKVEPSTQIGHDQGVYIEKNHHIHPGKPGQKVAGPEFVQYIAKRFDDVSAESDWIEKQLFGSI